MVACAVHLNQILLHVGPFQHQIHAVSTAQEKRKKNPMTCWESSSAVTQPKQKALYIHLCALGLV